MVFERTRYFTRTNFFNGEFGKHKMAYAAFFVLGYMFHACNADGAELTSMSAQAYSNNTARIESILDQDVRAGQEISDIVLEE